MATPGKWDVPVTLADIVRARSRIAQAIVRTPIIRSEAASSRAGLPVFLKLENVQHTGAFKIRGALSKITTLDDKDLQRGIICASSGNHGLGVAFAATRFGVRCIVVLPENANAHKVSLLKKLGAEIISCGLTSDIRQEKVNSLCAEHGYVQIHPFSDPVLIAGQGTIGLEILEDLPDVEEVYVPIGGGGLISGIAVAIKERRPDTRIYGVEPENSNAMTEALKHEGPFPLPQVNTIAEGLAARLTDELNYRIVRHYVDEVFLISDREILNSMMFLLEEGMILSEPSGAASIAGMLANTKRRGPAVAIISGGNITLNQIVQLRISGVI